MKSMSKTTISGLQKLINDRAEERLKADLDIWDNQLDTNVGLMRSLKKEFNDQVITVEGASGIVTLDLRSNFWSTHKSSTSGAFKHLWRKYLPVYIADETKKFLKEHDRGIKDIADMKDYLQNG